MKPALAVLLAAALALPFAGCFGLPEGAADNGDTVTIRYSAMDADGVVLRTDRTATFVLGSGGSGLGLVLERAVRGHVVNETFTVDVHDDPSLAFRHEVRVARALADIPTHQDAPKADFDASQFGPASVGKTFPAYGIYTGTVTAVTDTTVEFTIEASEGQRNSFPSIGAILVSNVVGDSIQRRLEPDVGAVFTIQPPSAFQPNTPLGLDPGSYLVVGATETDLVLSHSDSLQGDLIGQDLTYTVTIVRITPNAAGTVPEDGQYGVRNSPQVNGDPFGLLGGESDASAEHAH